MSARYSSPQHRGLRGGGDSRGVYVVVDGVTTPKTAQEVGVGCDRSLRKLRVDASRWELFVNEQDALWSRSRSNGDNVSRRNRSRSIRRISRFQLEHTNDAMTAIASAFTSEGFVIGADGRQLGKDKKIISEFSQKIFNFGYRHIDVVYAWCGETGVVNESNEVIYDLYAITRLALRSAVQLAGRPFPSFIQQSCTGIYEGIIKSLVVRQITNSDSLPESKARMLLNGYFDGQPFMTEFHVRETDRIRVQAERVLMPIPTPTRNLFNGCTRQNKKYENVLPTTTLEALKLVSDYIRECIDNSDPDCSAVGGHRHIAHLTSDGFYWIDAPKNSN